MHACLDEGLDGSEPNTVSLRRDVPVLDVNDNAPTFRDRPYSFSVSEATKLGARLFDKVLVSDSDGGLNADISLVCVPSGPEDTACKHFMVETEKVRLVCRPVARFCEAGLFWDRGRAGVVGPAQRRGRGGGAMAAA